MSKGLGKLQLCILEVLQDTESKSMLIRQLYEAVEDKYWKESIVQTQVQWHESWLAFYKDEDKPELNRRRAAIGQAITSLIKRSLIAKIAVEGSIYITESGRKMIRINSINK